MPEFRTPALWQVEGLLRSATQPHSGGDRRSLTFEAPSFALAAAWAEDALLYRWSSTTHFAIVESLARVPNGQGLDATRIIVIDEKEA